MMKKRRSRLLSFLIGMSSLVCCSGLLGFEDQPEGKKDQANPQANMKEVVIPEKADLELSVHDIPSTLKLDLGKQLTSTSVHRWIRLHNRTGQELKVTTATTNCGCVVGYIPQSLMKADESMMFSLNLNLPSEREIVSREVTMVVGPAANDCIKIQVAAEAVPIVSLEPPLLQLRDSSDTAEFSVVKNFGDIALDGAQLKVEGDGFFQPQQLSVEESKKTYLVALKSNAQGRPRISGFERFKLVLKDGKTLPLDLRVERVHELRLAPSEVSARQNEEGKKFFQFMLVGDRDNIDLASLSIFPQDADRAPLENANTPMKLVKTAKKFWLFEVSLDEFTFPKDATSAIFELRAGDRKLGEVVVIHE